MYREIKYAGFKKEITNLLRDRLRLKAKIRASKKRIEKHEVSIKISDGELNKVEEELEILLKKAGN